MIIPMSHPLSVAQQDAIIVSLSEKKRTHRLIELLTSVVDVAIRTLEDMLENNTYPTSRLLAQFFNLILNLYTTTSTLTNEMTLDIIVFLGMMERIVQRSGLHIFKGLWKIER